MSTPVFLLAIQKDICIQKACAYDLRNDFWNLFDRQILIDSELVDWFQIADYILAFYGKESKVWLLVQFCHIFY